MTDHFSSVGDVDDAVLSKTDKEALDFAWKHSVTTANFASATSPITIQSWWQKGPVR